MTVARIGPISAMSAKKTRKAIAVHTSASPTIARISSAVARRGGLAAAKGAQTTALMSSDAATTPTDGRSLNRRLSTSGPVA